MTVTENRVRIEKNFENMGDVHMVALVARQSVILKCNMQASVMIGNYEFYYGAGLFCKLQGITAEEEIGRAHV